MAVKKESNVNWKKIIDDFRNEYTVENKIDVVFIEVIANSIDSNARKIQIRVDFKGNSIKFLDDGNGMNDKQFDDYHNLGSLEKTRGKTIGFAGIGAKLYLDRCKLVKTYTLQRGETTGRGSLWQFEEGKMAPTYDPSFKLKRADTDPPSGTFVEILEPYDLKDVNIEHIRKVILDHYNFAMDGYVDRPLYITLNDELVKIRSLGSKSAEISSNTSISAGKSVEDLQKKGRKRRRVTLYGQVSYNNESTIEGVAIVVNGKTIEYSKDLFGLKSELKNPDSSKMIHGYVRCDELIGTVGTSKDKFNTTKSEYLRFKQAASVELKRVLSGWKLLKEEKKGSYSLIFKEASELLGRLMREMGLLGLPLRGDIQKRKVLIKDDAGKLSVAETDGKQSVSSETGKETPVIPFLHTPVTGLEEGKAPDENKIGEIRASYSKRHSFGGPKIAIISEDDPENVKRADIKGDKLVLYGSHPSYTFMGQLGVNLMYYTIDSAIECLCEIKGDEDQLKCKKEMYQKILQIYQSSKGGVAR